MVTKYYCDRCGLEISKSDDVEMIDFFKDFDSNFKGIRLPLLCDDCMVEFEILLKRFLEEGKKLREEE